MSLSYSSNCIKDQLMYTIAGRQRGQQAKTGTGAVYLGHMCTKRLDVVR